MSLLQINNDNPIIIPSVEEKIYPDLYITGLTLYTNPSGNGEYQSLQVILQPYNFETKELAPIVNGPQISINGIVFNIDNIWVEAARVPMFAQIMGGIVVVVKLMIEEKRLLEKIANTEDSVEKSQYEAELSAIRIQLGIV